MDIDFLRPDWPAPNNVHALQTLRGGGVSRGVYTSLNLATHVADAEADVTENRHRLRALLPSEPLWLNQVHGVDVVDAAHACSGVSADAIYSRNPHTVCAVMTADCLPVLFCSDTGDVVAAAHAGWRGLAAGVLESTVAAMNVPAKRILAWLGPAIGPAVFEVGVEVRTAFVAKHTAAIHAFMLKENGRFLADIYELARIQLIELGVDRIFGGGNCTFSDSAQFFSYRRDGNTGRMATLVWIS